MHGSNRAVARHRPPLLDLRLTLVDAPSVWRCVRMSSGATLARAQRVFCVLFGWPGGRPHAFSAGTLHLASGGVEERALTDTRLRHVIPDVGAELEFEYGEPPFQVHVVVERLLPPNDGVTAPTCLGGAGEAPHIDSGGAWAWEEPHEVEEVPAYRGSLSISVNVHAINAELERLP